MLKIQSLPMADLEMNIGQIPEIPMNPRQWSRAEVDKLAASLRETPELFEARPLLVYPHDGKYVILGGNLRYEASKANKAEAVPCIVFPADTPADKLKEIVIKDNGSFGSWDYDALANEWDDLDLTAWGVPAWHGGGDEGDGFEGGGGTGEGMPGEIQVSLADRFIIPPFSFFDTRKGYWQERKKAWRRLIGDLGESREDLLSGSLEMKYTDIYKASRAERERLGITFKEYLEKYVPEEELEASRRVLATGVSLLDPVLAEIVCKWFGREGVNKMFDCFAGDTIFGYVAAHLGNDFTGIELRPEQAAINNARVAGMTARYICDDGQNVATHIPAASQDLLFSCPPYFDLEKYSDLPNDASNQRDYEAFIGILRKAFTDAVGCLKDNRFAVIVVSDIRNKATGFYYDFCGDIKRIFADAGMGLLNEVILLNAIGSGAMRSLKYMENRKVVKVHQNVLVFYKGNAGEVKKHFKKIEYGSQDLESFAMDFGNEAGGADDEV